MTTKDIKRIVDDEQVEQLTTQLCRHWEVATERLEGLAKELEDGMDTCAARLCGEVDRAAVEREVRPAADILLRHGEPVAETALRLVA